MLTKAEIRQMQPKEWSEELLKAKKDLFKIKFNIKSGHTKESHIVRGLRKYIARLETIQRELMPKKAEVASPIPTAKATKKTTKKSAKSQTSKSPAAAGTPR